MSEIPKARSDEACSPGGTEGLRQGRHAVTRHLWGGLRDARILFKQPFSLPPRQFQRSHLQPHATRRPTRLASSGQLMAQGSGSYCRDLAPCR